MNEMEVERRVAMTMTGRRSSFTYARFRFWIDSISVPTVLEILDRFDASRLTRGNQMILAGDE
jgi:hypothetical protein